MCVSPPAGHAECVHRAAAGSKHCCEFHRLGPSHAPAQARLQPGKKSYYPRRCTSCGSTTRGVAQRRERPTREVQDHRHHAERAFQGAGGLQSCSGRR
ncbi:hypothetical protein NFI96_031942 [Prochilodus magdalenae]|nr:hypothetical protein NFI96_031942 [Prochilodus magdalenae]